HGMDLGTDRDRAKLHCVARLDWRLGAAQNLVSGAHVARRQNIASLAVDVLDQGDVRAAIGIVFDPLDDAANPVLVATKIDATIMMLVSATTMTRGHPAGVVAAAGAALGFQQRRVRL